MNIRSKKISTILMMLDLMNEWIGPEESEGFDDREEMAVQFCNWLDRKLQWEQLENLINHETK